MRELIADLLREIPASRKEWLFSAGSLVLMIVYIYFGSAEFYMKHISWAPGGRIDVNFASQVYQCLSSFFLFFVVPALVVKFALREKLSSYGFSKGDAKFGFKFALIAFLLFLPFLYLSSLTPDFQNEYPLPLAARNNLSMLILWEICYLTYYIGWESLFRGFMLFGLTSLGSFSAVAIQTAASTIIHMGKPFGETTAALFAGFLFGAAVLRVRSIYPVLVLHYLIGVSTDIFCFINRP